jgi:quinol monooxygenase YgiN
MAIRLIVTITAAPGRGSELAKLYKARCTEVMNQPGCEQFEIFQSAMHPDKLVLLERWTDQGVLDAHAN